MNNNELKHYGILGMKWGVRRGESRPSGAKKSSKSEDHIRAKSLKKKRLSQLSNDELKELNNRMQLEATYKSLKKQNISAGKKFMKDVAYETAKSTASSYAKKYAQKGIDYMLESATK